MADNARPIIIKKIIEEGGHGHHGGAWKVAYADFVTAMMAFFLLLWLLSTSSEETLKGLAIYFSEATVDTGPPGGAGGILQGLTLTPSTMPQSPASPINVDPTFALKKTDEPSEKTFELEITEPTDNTGVDSGISMDEVDQEELERQLERHEQEKFEEAKAAIVASMSGNAELQALKDSLVFEQTPEGLRIQILDRDQLAMFPVGSAVMYGHTKKLLAAVNAGIKNLPNKISIRGHTDSLPFAPGNGYDNWNLSADRSNATRRALIDMGLDQRRLADVVGKADAEHLFPQAPNDPRNRRISIVLLHDKAGKPAALPAANGKG